MIDINNNTIGSFDINITGTISFSLFNNYTLTNFWVGPGDQGFEVTITPEQDNFPVNTISQISQYIWSCLGLLTNQYQINLFEYIF